MLIILKWTTMLLRQNFDVSLQYGLRMIDQPLGGRLPYDNVVFSPASLSAVLAICYLGSAPDSETRSQIGNTIFRADVPNHKVNTTLDLGRYLNLRQDTMQLLAMVYADKKFQFKEEYPKLFQRNRSVNAISVDFTHDSDSAIDEINAWAKGITSGGMQKLIQPGMVTNETELLLVSGFHMNNPWIYPFDPYETRKQNFFEITGEATEVDMMHGDMELMYYENHNIQFLQLHFGEPIVVMYIILPKSPQTLVDLIRKIDSNDIKHFIKESERYNITIDLPKFTINTSCSLKEDLSNLGIVDAFSQNANFSGMVEATSPQPRLSDVVHKAVIQVDEAGVNSGRSRPPCGKGKAISCTLPHPNLNLRSATFRADRPFLFLMDSLNDPVLLMGTFYGP